MVKSNKQPRPLPVTDRSSVSVSGSANYMEHTYCVVLHVVEAINFYGREMREGEREQIIMSAALNTVDFEVEGTPSVTAETIIFNSNCIWECDMAGIKRIKTDHRPVKVTFYACSNSERKTIGSLLLPVRGLPVLGTGGNNSPLQLKMFWHKLICISNEFRSHKPEVLLMLAIIKKSLLHTKDFKHLTAFNSSEKESRTPPLQSPGHSITANMLQSQANVYVQSLVQLGLLQVGNDPLVDCDIIEVVLQFKQLKNLNKFVKSLYQEKDAVETVLLMFDFVGNVTNIELKLNNTDAYTLNDVLGLRFKSSLRSIRLYFQRIFYLPINMYINGTSIANYRMDFGKLLPPDNFFANKRKYVQSGSFAFERFGRMGSARELKPIMDYTFTVDIQEVYWRQQEKEPEPQLKQQQLHEEQLDLQSVGSKAVIREVPKDRAHDNVVDWNPKSEKQSASTNSSLNSLNVGAELSASDERDTASESPLSDAPDSDTPVTVHTSQTRRRKFTRLLVDNPKHEEEEGKDHQYTSKVVTRKLSTRFELEDEQLPENYLMDLPDDIGSDSELYACYSNTSLKKEEDCLPVRSEKARELRKHKPSNSDDRCLEEQLSKKTRSEKNRNPKEIDSQRSFQKPIQPMDARTTRFLQEEMQLRENIAKRVGTKPTVDDVDEYQINDGNIDDSWVELGQENDKFSPQMTKEGRPRRTVKSKLVEGDEVPLEAKTTPRIRKSRLLAVSAEVDEMDTSCPDATLINLKEERIKTTVKKLSADDPLGIQPKVIRKKKIISKTEEFELLENNELSNTNPRKPAKPADESKYVASQGSLDAVEPDIDYVSQKLKRVSRDGLGGKPINKLVDQSSDMDTLTETDELEEFLQKPSAQKNKSKQSIKAETKTFETVLIKKTSKTKKPPMSKTDLSLSARWVEVSKEQTKALEETEQYIEATCKAELDETYFKKQHSEGHKKSTNNNLERSSRTIQRQNIEYKDVSKCSEMEPSIESSIIEEPFKQPKLERKVLKKKRSADLRKDQELMVTQMQSEMETSVNNSITEEPFKQKTSVEQEKNQSRLNTNRSQKLVLQETENVTSEMESVELEKANLIRKHERKSRRVVKQTSLQKYLDAEEASLAGLPQDSGDKAEQPIKKRTVKATPFAPAKVESSELKPIERNKPMKQRTTKASAVSSLEHDLINKLCDVKKTFGESQLEADAKVSRLEVTVHMYDQTKTPAVEAAKASATCVNQSVNTDITNMDESIKQILAAGKQLQDEMQRKALEYMDNLDQRRSETDISQQPVDNQAHNSVNEESNGCANYECKFYELEQHILVLEQHLRKFESRTQEMQQMNFTLAQEKMKLKERIALMEQQIAQLCQQGASGNELQQVLSEMRIQNVRYMDMSKAKDRYKKQWRRSAKRVHALKLAMYEKKVEHEKNMPANVLNLKNILTQDAEEFEREYGRFRRSGTALSFSASGDSSEPLLKDYLRGLSSQTVHQHKPTNHVDSTRMH
ncbi:centromere protein F isoform X2 [Drosophila montana]|uniref:centromere protein F isoform X2 n=1 Tax=Drosophila montana TaxID=40370 RepID=UPI00313EB793